MNSCILMVKMISDPELRHAKQQDGGDSIPVTSVLVEFESTQPDQPKMTLKVVAWRDSAEDLKQKYAKGDRAIVQGRLAMNTIDRNGIKEKKAELVVSRIYPVGEVGGLNLGLDNDYQEQSFSAPTNNNFGEELDLYPSTKNEEIATKTEVVTTSTIDEDKPIVKEEDWDNIPF